MKVSKAIEILEFETHNYPQKGTDNCVDALKLGIEALKRHRDRDYLLYSELHQGLPGESPEEEVKIGD